MAGIYPEQKYKILQEETKVFQSARLGEMNTF